ncbi:MAG: DUF192 domain-containing protein [Tsuneonella sp.]
MRIAITAVFAAALAACSAQPVSGPTPAASPAVHPVSGLRVIPLTVARQNGRHTFRVEVASSEEEQAKGLMFRTQLGPDEGMIFPRNPPDYASFWMKNTPLPLDIIFIGVDGKINNIAANTTPYSLAPVSSEGLAKGVLEINGGRAAQLGIAAGDTVTW